MIRTLKKYSSYLWLILLSIAVYYFFNDEIYYLVVKYLTTFRALDIMCSILFTFLLFKIYLDNYYYIVLNRNNVISRVGRKKYYLIIIKKLLLHSVMLIFINVFLDWLLAGNFNLIYILFNVLLAAVSVMLLPKRKEYDNELLFIMVVAIIIKVIVFRIVIY